MDGPPYRSFADARGPPTDWAASAGAHSTTTVCQRSSTTATRVGTASPPVTTSWSCGKSTLRTRSSHTRRRGRPTGGPGTRARGGKGTGGTRCREAGPMVRQTRHFCSSHKTWSTGNTGTGFTSLGRRATARSPTSSRWVTGTCCSSPATQGESSTISAGTPSKGSIRSNTAG